jgi:hypothetical protein
VSLHFDGMVRADCAATIRMIGAKVFPLDLAPDFSGHPAVARETGTGGCPRWWFGDSEAALPYRDEAGEQSVALRHGRLGPAPAGSGPQHRHLLRLRHGGEDRVAARRGTGRDAAADAHIDAEANDARLHPLDIDDGGTIAHADGSRFILSPTRSRSSGRASVRRSGPGRGSGQATPDPGRPGVGLDRLTCRAAASNGPPGG